MTIGHPKDDDTGQAVLATRRAAGLFEMSHRGLLEVRGEDRVRWLDGMISGDVQALEEAGTGAGCYATLLTNRGAIVADLHVARFDEAYLLESARDAIGHVREVLERYVIADDVVLVDVSDDSSVLGLEGPQAKSILDAVASPGLTELPSDHWAEVRIADRPALVAAFGFSGESAYQIRLAAEDREAIEAALVAAAGEPGLVRGDREALEILRVEAGIPALGAELDEEVLPPEARLEHAISTSKGCYIGQEIVARLRARGQVNHLLVGFRIEADADLDVGIQVSVDGRVTGEMTSIVRSPSQGAIALGYVRREHAISGTPVEFEGGRGQVVELPFVELGGRAADEAGTP